MFYLNILDLQTIVLKTLHFKIYYCIFLNYYLEEGFAKYGDSLYKPIIKKGYNTHAWKKMCTIKEYIYLKTDYKTNYIQWKNVTANGGSNYANAEKHFIEFLIYL